MTEDKPDESGKLARRVKILRDMSQGEGMTLEKLEALGDDEVQLFGVDSPLDLQDLITRAAFALLDDPHAKAIRNALNLDESTSSPNLTERRFEFASRGEGVKPRTLIDHEIRGAEKLARQIDTMTQLRPESIAVLNLRHRVEVLEKLVDALLSLLADSGIENLASDSGLIVSRRGTEDADSAPGYAAYVGLKGQDKHEVLIDDDGMVQKLIIPSEILQSIEQLRPK